MKSSPSVGVADVIAGITLLMSFLLVAGDSFGRSVLGMTIPHGAEIATFLLVWLVMAGGVACTRRGEHLATDIVTSALSANLKPWFQRATHLLVALISACLAVYAAQYAWLGRMRTSESLELPLMFAYIALPLGFASMAVMELGAALRRRG